MKRQFEDLWRRIGASTDPIPVFEELHGLYSEAHRAYHDLDHIRTCLAAFDGVRDLARRPDEVEAALWFHDAIYDPGAPDNEARSAEVADRTLAAAGIAGTVRERVAAMILATIHDVAPDDADARLVVDIDLVGLGSAREVFEENGRRIRREFARFSDEEFREGQEKLFRRFLDREVIYLTPHFRERHEATARENLRRVLEEGE